MRRAVLFASILAVLVVGVFLIGALDLASRNPQLGFWTGLSDIVFLIRGHYRQFRDKPVPHLEAKGQRRLIERLHPHRDLEVRRLAARWLTELPTAEVLTQALPFIDFPFHRERFEPGALAVGKIKARGAVPKLLTALAVSEEFPIRYAAIKVLGEIGDPRAVEALQDTARHPRTQNEPGLTHNERTASVEALAKIGGDGSRFVIEEARRVSATEEVEGFIMALAKTGELEAARVLVRLMSHAKQTIRRQAGDCLDEMGAVGVEAALEALETESDGFLISELIKKVFDDDDAQGYPRVIAVLEEFRHDPSFNNDVRHSLMGLGTPAAIDLLLQDMQRSKQHWKVLETLAEIGPAALPVMVRYLAYEDAGVRRETIYRLGELLDPRARPHFEWMLNDPDPKVRKESASALFRLDLVALYESFLQYVPEKNRDKYRIALRKKLKSGTFYWSKERKILQILKSAHSAGVMFSLFIGLLLVFNWARGMEPYRFQLLILFLLLEGFLGDFFLMSKTTVLYRNVTSVHLILLIGFFFMERDREPGALKSRFERLGGASVWLFVPALLFMGVPILTEALRSSLRHFPTVAAWFALVLFSAFLLLENALLPWSFSPRTVRFKSVTIGVLAFGLLGFLSEALRHMAFEKWSAGDRDSVVLCVVVAVPFLIMIFYHVHQMRLRRSEVWSVSLPQPPSKRLRVIQDGHVVTVRLPSERPKLSISDYIFGAPMIIFLIVFCLGVIVLTLFRLESVSGRDGTPEFIGVMILGVVGAALTYLLLHLLFSQNILQIRKGYARYGTVLCGGILGHAPWSTQIPAGGRVPHLTPVEQKWLRDLLQHFASDNA